MSVYLGVKIAFYLIFVECEIQDVVSDNLKVSLALKSASLSLSDGDLP